MTSALTAMLLVFSLFVPSDKNHLMHLMIFLAKLKT